MASVRVDTTSPSASPPCSTTGTHLAGVNFARETTAGEPIPFRSRPQLREDRTDPRPFPPDPVTVCPKSPPEGFAPLAWIPNHPVFLPQQQPLAFGSWGIGVLAATDVTST